MSIHATQGKVSRYLYDKMTRNVQFLAEVNFKSIIYFIKIRGRINNLTRILIFNGDDNSSH